MTCEIYMVGLPIMPIKASIFRPSLVYECLSLLGECWDNGLSRVCVVWTGDISISTSGIA